MLSWQAEAPWRIEHPYSLAAASDDLVATCGQAAIAEFGDVLFPGDLMAQAHHILATQERNACRALFQQRARDDAAVLIVFIPPLFYSAC